MKITLHFLLKILKIITYTIKEKCINIYLNSDREQVLFMLPIEMLILIK